MDLHVQSLQDDRIGGSIDESEFDRRNSICREVLSLNEYRINKGVGRSRIHKEFKTISESVSDVKESVSESGFERVDALRVRVFARGSSTQSSGHAESQDCSVFFRIMPEDVEFVLIRLGPLGFGGS